jgi:hypothetical protein
MRNLLSEVNQARGQASPREWEIVRGFSSLAEVETELNRLDAVLGVMMQGFDKAMGDRSFDRLMADCNSMVEHMDYLARLAMQLKRGGQ